jgi:hypothetical protein
MKKLSPYSRAFLLAGLRIPKAAQQGDSSASAMSDAKRELIKDRYERRAAPYLQGRHRNGARPRRQAQGLERGTNEFTCIPT